MATYAAQFWLVGRGGNFRVPGRLRGCAPLFPEIPGRRRPGAELSRDRRAGQIYLAHIVTIVAVLALFAAAAISFQEPELATRNPLALSMFLDDPVAGIVGVAILSQQFGFLDILPLYVVLMATLPVLMVLARIDLRLALGVSISLYLATQFLGLTLP